MIVRVPDPKFRPLILYVRALVVHGRHGVSDRVEAHGERMGLVIDDLVFALNNFGTREAPVPLDPILRTPFQVWVHRRVNVRIAGQDMRLLLLGWEGRRAQ